MFLIKNWRFALAGLAVLVITTILILAYRHYDGLVTENAAQRETIGRLETNIATQSATIETQTGVIAEWAASARRTEAALQRLEEVQRDATAESQRLRRLFSEHSLGDLAAARPGLLERAVNSGTARARRMLECASGADLPDCPN